MTRGYEIYRFNLERSLGKLDFPKKIFGHRIFGNRHALHPPDEEFKEGVRDRESTEKNIIKKSSK
jgi:hypothetical protein